MAEKDKVEYSEFSTDIESEKQRSQEYKKRLQKCIKLLKRRNERKRCKRVRMCNCNEMYKKRHVKKNATEPLEPPNKTLPAKKLPKAKKLVPNGPVNVKNKLHNKPHPPQDQVKRRVKKRKLQKGAPNKKKCANVDNECSSDSDEESQKYYKKKLKKCIKLLKRRNELEKCKRVKLNKKEGSEVYKKRLIKNAEAEPVEPPKKQPIDKQPLMNDNEEKLHSKPPQDQVKRTAQVQKLHKCVPTKKYTKKDQK